MRTSLAACSAAVLFAALAPGEAAAAGVVVCRLTYGSTNGVTSGYGNCTVTPGGSFTISFTAQNSCPFQSVSGSASGALNFQFNWQRVANVGAITMSGSLTAASSAVWSSACPASGETVIFGG